MYPRGLLSASSFSSLARHSACSRVGNLPTSRFPKNITATTLKELSCTAPPPCPASPSNANIASPHLRGKGRRRSSERPYLGLPVDPARDAQKGRGALRAQGDRYPQARQELPPLHLRRLRSACQEARRRPRRARSREERPRGDPRLEHLQAPRGVLRHPVLGD